MNVLRMPTPKKTGFTLLELIVVVGIIALVSVVVLANYRTYNLDASLANNAYDLALTVRQTQLYGISVKETTAGSGQFQTGYGLHFSTKSNSYIVYQDVYDPLLLQYDSNNATELVSVNQLPVGFTIQKICTVTTISSVLTEQCVNATNTGTSFIDIEFIRPNPEAIITTNIPNPPATLVTYQPATMSTQYGARIYLTNGTKVRSVYIDKTGQIAVN
jgi:prepilin-type N-terminal cleavage/methylation domain-containing protein